LRGDNIDYRFLSGESRIANPGTIEYWKNYRLFHEILCDALSADVTGLFFSLQPCKTFTFQRYFCRGGIKSKQRVTVLLMCNADGNDKLPPLVTEKYKSPHCFKNVKILPTEYETNTNSWITTKIFEYCCT
jgi:hypothetical protein